MSALAEIGVGAALRRLGPAMSLQALFRDAAVALCEQMNARAYLAIARYDLGRLLVPDGEGLRLLGQAAAASGGV